MSLLIQHPPGYEAERAYILQIVFGDFLGLEYRAQSADVTMTRISLDGRELLVDDTFFQTPAGEWLHHKSLPRLPLKQWEGLPVLFGTPVLLDARCGIDLLGSCFFLLSRYEEAIPFESDSHERFPSSASLAKRAGFLHRPLVNEYVDLLWRLLQARWPRLNKKAREYRTILTHDVDTPFGVAGRSPFLVARSFAADILRRRDPVLGLRRLKAVPAVRRGNLDADVCNAFDYIMELSDRHGTKSAFYFFAGTTDKTMDGDYSVRHPWFRKLFRKIGAGGHEIGLHTSYLTFQDPGATKREFEALRTVCGEEGIEQGEWGGRQHYLRWENPTTWRNWDDAGLDYDATLGFADEVGFRCSVCYPYRVFDLRARKPLRLVERPLIAMEGALLHYQGKALEEAVEKMTRLARECRRYAGEFVLLWHNSRLISRDERRAYECLVGSVTRP